MQSHVVYSQYYNIKGIVTNANLEPMPLVNVAVLDHAHLNTITNNIGEYEIKITEGSYVLVFTFLDYNTLKIPVTITNTDITQNVIMEIKNMFTDAAVVKSKKIDRSEEIIKKVIANKQLYQNTAPYTVKAYIKATEEETSTSSVSNKKKKDTSVQKPQMQLAEIYMTLNCEPPLKIKEERTGVNIRGNEDGLFYLSHTDGAFNWYKNLVQIPALSESPILSPISNSGIVAYKFKAIKTYTENGRKYYRIKVMPGALGNALVSGEITVMDSAWCLMNVKLTMPKYHIVEYDGFEINQQYQFIDSNYCLQKQEFIYHAKYGKAKSSGRTVVYYSDYVFNKQFKKRFFNNELSATSQQAYERDSTFWHTIRQEPFTANELAFIRKSDSTKALQSQKYWQDSVDRDFNKVTFKKLFFTGQGNYKRSAERTWYFKPLAFTYMPFYIAGQRLIYRVGFEKEFKNKKTIAVSARPNYGILNEDLKGSVNIGRLYNPFNRGYYNINVGSDFGIINAFNGIVSIFNRNNFYAHDYINLSHRIEIINGLYLYNSLEYANRRSIANYQFENPSDTISGSLYNKPFNFDFYKALYTNINLSYVPFQKYIREPFQKQILGSKWPTFSAMYKKGINGFGSVIDFDYLEFDIAQELKLGLVGVSKYKITTGEFLTHKNLKPIDFKYQLRAGPILFFNPLYSFQGIDTSYSTIKRFYEAHYFHRFNGAILNKIPWLKKVKLIECVGGGLLYTKDRNFKYAEVFVGVEKVIRIWKERIRIGAFYTAGVSNYYTYQPQFKFSIDIYDAFSNQWSY